MSETQIIIQLLIVLIMIINLSFVTSKILIFIKENKTNKLIHYSIILILWLLSFIYLVLLYNTFKKYSVL